MSRLRYTLPAIFLSGSLVAVLIGGCTFDDRDLEEREAIDEAAGGPANFTPEDPSADAGNSCADAFDAFCDEGGICDSGTDTADCFQVNGDEVCPFTEDGVCDEGFLCAYGSDTIDCQNDPHSDTCEFALDGWCDEAVFCDAGTDFTDCSTFTRTVSCGFAYTALLELYDSCSGQTVDLLLCEGEDQASILEMFSCAHEALTTSCESLDAEGLPLHCDFLVEQGVLAYTVN